MTKKLTLLLTLLIMVSVVFSASDDSAKGSGSRLVVTPLKLDRAINDSDDSDSRNKRTVADIVGVLTLRQNFPPAKFSVFQNKEWLIIVKSDERFRIDRSSPLYERVESAARQVELEKAARHAQDNPGSPPQKPREVTPEDRHAIICRLFGININMTNEQILNQIAKATKKDAREVRYEALGMVPKERPDTHFLSEPEDQ